MKRSLVRSSFAVLALGVFTLVGCAETDVVGQVALTSFRAMTEALGDRLLFDDARGDRLSSGSGDSLSIARDFRGTPDFVIETPLQPFLDAGLDTTKLPQTDVQYAVEGTNLQLRFDWGSEPFPAPSGEASGSVPVLNTFRSILGAYRTRIGYHEKLDHYGFALGGGNMVEWAKDLSTNDKDLVFVLDPGALVSAGVDPTKVAGWTYAKVEVKDANGKVLQVDKLLRPFNLK